MPTCSLNLVADINHQEQIQRLATHLVTGMRQIPYEERMQWLGLHSLQRRRLHDDLITAFKIFKDLLDIDPNLRVLPPARRGLTGHPFKELQGASHRRRRGCEILEEAPGSRRYCSSCVCFQEAAGERLDSSLSPSPPLTGHSPPPPSHLHTTH